MKKHLGAALPQRNFLDFQAEPRDIEKKKEKGRKKNEKNNTLGELH
jgi:hypothetical protein